jgi:thiamine-phosphate pyrophosphorylase
VPPALRQEPAYLAALEACSELGFIAVDAQTVAQAWQCQSERTNQFDVTHWPDDPRDFGLGKADPALAFAHCPRELGLYGVLPTAEWVGRMARAGVPTVQLRFKSGDRAAVAQEVKAAVEAVKGTQARLFINDHRQAALDAGAYGIHVGQEDLDVIGQRDLQTIRQLGHTLGRLHPWLRRDGARPCRPAQLYRPGRGLSHHAQEDGDSPALARLAAMCG